MGAHSSAAIPSVNYNDAKLSYFIFNGIQSVKNAPTSIFKEAILRTLKGKKLNDACNDFMKSDALDMISRWFILNSLCEINRPLVLYRYFSDAEKALDQKEIIQ